MFYVDTVKHHEIGQGQNCLQEQKLNCKMSLWWVRTYKIESRRDLEVMQEKPFTIA